MKDHRWPKICLKEEIRGIINGYPTKWGKKVVKIFKEMVVEDVIKMIWESKEHEVIKTRIDEGLVNLWWKLLKSEWSRIERSSYNHLFKYMTINDEISYWEDVHKSKDKEIWARFRCGNIGRANKEGEKEWDYRLCGNENETICHLIKCNEAWKKVGKDSVEYIKDWLKDVDDQALIDEVVNLLGSSLNEKVCKYFRDIEKIIQIKSGTETQK